MAFDITTVVVLHMCCHNAREMNGILRTTQTKSLLFVEQAFSFNFRP